MSSERTHKIRRVLWNILYLNFAVAALKITVGIATQCLAIAADGFHSLSDGASNIVGLVGITIAAHPADPVHPYGRRKYETIAALIISFSLLFVSLSIIKESFGRLFHPIEPRVNWTGWAVLLITLVANCFIAWWEKKKAKELESDLLLADAWHTGSDILVTLSVIVALFGIRMGFRRVDAIVSFAIALFIGWIGWQILRQSSEVLCDHAVLDEKSVKNTVLKIRGVIDCHEIRSRGRPDDIRLDLHVLVEAQMTVEASHHAANLIERDLRAFFPGLADVLIHIEPSHHDHEELGKKHS